MTKEEFGILYEELLKVFTQQELVRLINLISPDGNVEIMCKEIKDASKRSFLNEKLWDKLKYLDGRGELPIHDLVRISEYITDKRDGIYLHLLSEKDE